MTGERQDHDPNDEVTLNPATTARQALRILTLVLRLLFAAFIIASLALSATSLAKLSAQSDTLVRLSQDNQRLNEIMLDCTRPKGKCFEDGQTRTGQAVGTINQVTIAASYCAKSLPTNTSMDTLRKCIEREMAKAPK